MDYYALTATQALSDYVTIATLDGVSLVRIQHPLAKAAISLHGGHVISFQPEGKPDLIWMSDKANYDGKAALRGGIPVCWPWFGRIAAPAHGFARSQTWKFLEHRESDKGVIVEIGLNASEESLAIWPNQFELRLQVEVGEQLITRLIVNNVDTKPWHFSGALHSYLNIGDIDQIEISGMGPEFIDGLKENQIGQGGETLEIHESFDRVYTQPQDTVSIKDKSLDRTIEITNSGHNSAVIWNPWLEVAQSMADMDDNGYQTMVCVESTIHAPTIEDGITLQPGESHTLSTVISSK